MKLIQPRGVCHTLVTELTHKQITLIFFFFLFLEQEPGLEDPCSSPAPRLRYNPSQLDLKNTQKNIIYIIKPRLGLEVA